VYAICFCDDVGCGDGENAERMIMADKVIDKHVVVVGRVTGYRYREKVQEPSLSSPVE
jgi:hypothetical protein